MKGPSLEERREAVLALEAPTLRDLRVLIAAIAGLVSPRRETIRAQLLAISEQPALLLDETRPEGKSLRRLIRLAESKESKISKRLRRSLCYLRVHIDVLMFSESDVHGGPGDEASLGEAFLARSVLPQDAAAESVALGAAPSGELDVPNLLLPDELREELSGDDSEAKFQILRKLGEGALGVVYRADNLRTRAPVALKFLKLRSIPKGLREELERAVDQEAGIGARLADPHLVRVFDLEPAPGESLSFRPGFAAPPGELEALRSTPCIVMEYVRGQNLSQLLRDDLFAGYLPPENPNGVRPRLEPLAALLVLEQLLRGLSAAHRGGVLHLDVKPGNYMVTQRFIRKLKEHFDAESCRVPPDELLELLLGQRYKIWAKLNDLGLSRRRRRVGLVSEEGSTAALRSLESVGSDEQSAFEAVLELDTVAGSPPFMAPEQARLVDGRARASVSEASDVFALGMIFASLLTGEKPQSLRERCEGLVSWAEPFALLRQLAAVPSELQSAIDLDDEAFDHLRRNPSFPEETGRCLELLVAMGARDPRRRVRRDELQRQLEELIDALTTRRLGVPARKAAERLRRASSGEWETFVDEADDESSDAALGRRHSSRRSRLSADSRSGSGVLSRLQEENPTRSSTGLLMGLGVGLLMLPLGVILGRSLAPKSRAGQERPKLGSRRESLLAATALLDAWRQVSGGEEGRELDRTALRAGCREAKGRGAALASTLGAWSIAPNQPEFALEEAFRQHLCLALKKAAAQALAIERLLSCEGARGLAPVAARPRFGSLAGREILEPARPLHIDLAAAIRSCHESGCGRVTLQLEGELRSSLRLTEWKALRQRLERSLPADPALKQRLLGLIMAIQGELIPRHQTLRLGDDRSVGEEIRGVLRVLREELGG